MDQTSLIQEQSAFDPFPQKMVPGVVYRGLLCIYFPKILFEFLKNKPLGYAPCDVT